MDLFDSKVGRRAKTADINLSAEGLTRAYWVSQRLPQVIVKITSYSHSGSRSQAHGKYISRDQEEDLEDPQGYKLSGEEIPGRIAEWSEDFDDTKKRSRETVHIVLSSPKNSPLHGVEKAVREFAKKTFGKSHDYLFAIHDDTANPHGHLMVKMRPYDGGKRLNPRREDLQHWREAYAKELRAQGTQVDASPRLARGQGKKARAHAINRVIERNEEKATASKTPRALTRIEKREKAQLKDYLRKRESPKDEPWVKAAKKVSEDYRTRYLTLGASAEKTGKAIGDKDLEHMGTAILAYAKTMPVPESRLETAYNEVKGKSPPEIER